MQGFIKRCAVSLALVSLFFGFASPAQASTQSLTYFYAGGQQGGLTETSVGANLSIENPALSAGDFHTLAELAVSSADGNQTIEIGWTKDPTTFGDNLTHLFVGRWVNNVFGGYNSGGWVDYASNPVNAGAPLTSAVGTELPFSIQHFTTNWWLYYNGTAIGSFPDSLWSGTFTSFNLFQGFGEVAANSSTPCTDMMKGALVTTTVGGRVGSVTYSSGTAGVNLGLITPTNASYYNDASASARTVRFGGPGAC